ncbi:hypothetical protein LCGC14_2433830 [marine sediment metagenome]|uniref:Uncharacterized protein n=1 Tax=marine sediment metagenome TaxID=412755 RepID=A0A0F9BL77_9ZZZZ
MAVKKTKKTLPPQSKELGRIAESLEVLIDQLTSVIYIISGDKAKKEQEDFGQKTQETGKDAEVPTVKQNLISQSGEVVELNYDTVKAEANTLVTKDEHGAQLGFAKAREIIIGYGVTKLEEVGKEFYPEIVAKFRKALNEWK